MTVKLSHIKQALAEIGTLPRESMRHWSASDLAHVTIDNAMPVLLEIVEADIAERQAKAEFDRLVSGTTPSSLTERQHAHRKLGAARERHDAALSKVSP